MSRPGAARRGRQHPQRVDGEDVLTEHGEVRVETPRDRKGRFEPQIVRKRQRRFEGFDEKIIALYAAG